MTPAAMRARADREERIYGQKELAAMLRAGADALDELARLTVQPDHADEYEWNSRYDAKWEVTK